MAYIKEQCNSIAGLVADGQAPERKAPDDGVGGWQRPKEVGIFKEKNKKKRTKEEEEAAKEAKNEKSKVYRSENREAKNEKAKVYRSENKEEIAKKRMAPAAIEERKRYNHEKYQDKLEAAHTKNKKKGEFVRKIYETKEPSKKKQLKEASQQIQRQRKEAPTKTTTSTSSSGRKRQLPARFI
jgi:hypothetical protein